MARKKVRARSSQSSIHTNTANKLASDLMRLTKEQLKAECRKRGLKTTGTKSELVQRLVNYNMINQRKDTSSTNGSTPNNVKHTSNSKLRNELQREKEERENLLIWKTPLKTLYYFAMEVFILLKTYGNKLYTNRLNVSLVVISVLILGFLSNVAGPHQVILQAFNKKLIWCLYWTGLGILSSVGLGTGLHTFLLYLGPHIANVTIAAYECGSLNFPEPPYPDDIICPREAGGDVSIFAIMSKVRLEAMCWGAGTALGELPPYFMARAARLSGIDSDDVDDLKEFEELKHKNKEDLTYVEKIKLFLEQMVKRAGFFGILACASIPNPLFDLAGITCGHFLVPFWTFFGATLIGKAIIKMHIQKLFVIIAFNDTLITTALSWFDIVPIIGDKLRAPFKSFLDGQKTKFHRKKSDNLPDSSNILSKLFEVFIFLMILYFVISIINSFAQNYHKRLHKVQTKKTTTDKAN